MIAQDGTTFAERWLARNRAAEPEPVPLPSFAPEAQTAGSWYARTREAPKFPDRVKFPQRSKFPSNAGEAIGQISSEVQISPRGQII